MVFLRFEYVFQLTHLLRGATAKALPKYENVIFQLTHLLRGATHGGRRRAGPADFNSRTSCEVRPKWMYNIATRLNFNSRTSCEVRRLVANFHFEVSNFNSRTSCEVRRSGGQHDPGGPGAFQLTHLLRGATPVRIRYPVIPANFNSRTSCEVRLAEKLGIKPIIAISTHAPLARCDLRGLVQR